MPKSQTFQVDEASASPSPVKGILKINKNRTEAAPQTGFLDIPTKKDSKLTVGVVQPTQASSMYIKKPTTELVSPLRRNQRQLTDRTLNKLGDIHQDNVCERTKYEEEKEKLWCDDDHEGSIDNDSDNLSSHDSFGMDSSEVEEEAELDSNQLKSF